MITANIVADKHIIKAVHHSQSMGNIRVIVPKGWDVDYVNVLLWDESESTLKISNPETAEFIIPNCREIFLKRVIKDSKRHYVYLPVSYDGKQVLIVPAP